MDLVLILFAVIQYVLFLFLRYLSLIDRTRRELSATDSCRLSEEIINGNLRNQRALKYSAIFFAILGVFAMPFSGSIVSTIKDKELSILMIKMIMLSLFIFNIMARSVVHQKTQGGGKYTFPLYIFFDVLIKTKWVMKEKGAIPVIVNFTGALLVLSVVSLAYISFA